MCHFLFFLPRKASSTLIGNPFLSNIPGAFTNVSINGGLQFNSISDLNVYKSILLTTLGNVGGEKLGEGFKTGSTLPGGKFMGETLGTTGGYVFDEITTLGNK